MGFRWTGRITSLSTPRRWTRTSHWTRFTAASTWNIPPITRDIPSRWGILWWFRQDGKQTAYYVDEGADYRQVPEFFAQPEKQLTPDECMTGEQIQTPRGRFYLTDRSREQMEAAGYGFHHQSEDGRYLIMANGTRAFAIPAQPESHIKTAEMSTEQNYNMIDGMMNNAPSMEELEARAKAGEQISLLDVAEATKAEAKKPKQTQKTTQKQKKPSIRAQLAAAKEEQKKKPPAREKSKEMEV